MLALPMYAMEIYEWEGLTLSGGQNNDPPPKLGTRPGRERRWLFHLQRSIGEPVTFLLSHVQRSPLAMFP